MKTIGPLFFPIKFIVSSIFLILIFQNIHASGLDHEPILPIPNISKSLNPQIVKLGEKLFHDTHLSADNTISCASCHIVNMGGVDGTPTSLGINGQRGGRNSPTVLNSSLHFSFFWDGRSKTLEDQVAGPINNPIEMGSNWEHVLNMIANDNYYKQSFIDLYPTGITSENVQDAIATYERTLLTPNSPFDLYLKGDNNAIDDKTKEGYKLFKSYGCSSCHQGVLLGGNMYQKIGVFKSYNRFNQGKKIDFGRYEITKKEEDKFYFKVPSLRNIELTAPYFHDGSEADLLQVIKIMAEYQLGQIMPEEDAQKILSFLYSLTGLQPAPLLK